MKKTNQCLLVDILMFLLLALMTGIGIMIKYVLFPGTERWEVYGRNVDLTFLGLDRHGWGTVHLIIALLFIALLVIHILLHWKCLVAYVCRAGVRKSRTAPLFVFFGFALLILILFPFMVNVKVTEMGDGRDRFINNAEINDLPAASQDRLSISREEQDNSTVVVDDRSGDKLKRTEHHDIDPDIEVLGSMTLIRVSLKYNVPVSHIIKELDLPGTVSGNEQLGRLRRLYGFKMADIDLIIHKYRHK